jgi:hypothetical protein
MTLSGKCFFSFYGEELSTGGHPMGSTGTGKFSDYPGGSGGKPNGPSGSPGGKGGKPEEADKCARSIKDTSLEEVALAEYFTNHKSVPPVKTKIKVRKKLVGGRVAVETSDRNEIIGFAPTAYNYLRSCMEKNWVYIGTVEDSTAGKLPKVKVDLLGSK